MEWGTDPRKGKGKQRKGKYTLVWTIGLGEKGETVGNMEMYKQKKRDRRDGKGDGQKSLIAEVQRRKAIQ